MIENRKSRRPRERSLLSLPVSVHCREGDDHEWVEMSRLIDASPFGARLTISRPTEGERLLQLVMQMPRYLRLRSPHYNIAVIAGVRRLRRGADGKKHLHLEFVDQQWPQLEEE